MIEDKTVSLYVNISDSFEIGSSVLNNHSALTVGKFILALSDQFKFRFISKLFSLNRCNFHVDSDVIGYAEG